jgi:hypothetical protein
MSRTERIVIDMQTYGRNDRGLKIKFRDAIITVPVTTGVPIKKDCDFNSGNNKSEYKGKQCMRLITALSGWEPVCLSVTYCLYVIQFYSSGSKGISFLNWQSLKLLRMFNFCEIRSFCCLKFRHFYFET